MGIMDEVAEDVQDILDKEGQPCIFSVTDGTTVFSVTCKAVPAAYHKSFDMDYAGEYQPPQQVSKTARVMVSEKALTALGYPVRNTADRVALKGHNITYTDSLTNKQNTYVVAEQYPNYLTGLIWLQLSDFAVETPPGRTIISWVSALIEIVVVDGTPSPETQELQNGDLIPIEYNLNAGGEVLADGRLAVAGTLTIPYLEGYRITTPVMYEQFAIDNMPYDIPNGTLNNNDSSGISVGAKIGLNAVIPLFASV